jgi:hypothetical protein
MLLQFLCDWHHPRDRLPVFADFKKNAVGVIERPVLLLSNSPALEKVVST